MTRARAWLGVSIAAALALACDPEPDVTYMAVGSAQETRDFDSGTYHSTNPSVLALIEVKDTSTSGCSGISLGCPGSEITIKGTSVTFQALAAGDASIRGTTDKGKELSVDFRVEEVTDLQVRRVVPINNSPADDQQLDVAPAEEIVVKSAGSSTLQINLLGKSRVALGYIENFQAVSGDEALLTVDKTLYSHGHRTYLKGVAPGTTTLSLTTPTVSRELAIRIED